MYTPKAHDPLPPLDIMERQIIQGARQLIADPKDWTQHDVAANSSGHVVDPVDDDATCFCAVGAVLRAGQEYPEPIVEKVLNHLMLRVEHLVDDDRYNITSVNDGVISDVEFPEHLRGMTPHQRVLYILDEALK